MVTRRNLFFFDTLLNSYVPVLYTKSLCCVLTHAGYKDSFKVDSTADAVFLSAVDSLSPRPAQLPMAIPRDLADK